MPQPPTAAVLAHENTRNLPSLSQKTFVQFVPVADTTFVWEFDLGLRVTDPNQFLVAANAAPGNSSTIAGGGAGPQTTPQPAIGPWADWAVQIEGGGGEMTVSYAVDASPANYFDIFFNTIPATVMTNSSGLRVTGRFVRFSLRVLVAGSVVNIGYYIRSWT